MAHNNTNTRRESRLSDENMMAETDTTVGAIISRAKCQQRATSISRPNPIMMSGMDDTTTAIKKSPSNQQNKMTATADNVLIRKTSHLGDATLHQRLQRSDSASVPKADSDSFAEFSYHYEPWSIKSMEDRKAIVMERRIQRAARFVVYVRSCFIVFGITVIALLIAMLIISPHANTPHQNATQPHTSVNVTTTPNIS